MKASNGSKIDPTDLLARARQDFAKFPGRTRRFDHRLYVHFQDYLAWADRQVEGDIPTVEVDLPAPPVRDVQSSLPAADEDADKQAQARLTALAQNFAEVLRGLYVGAGVAEICSKKFFESHSVLLDLVIDLRRGLMETFEAAVEFHNECQAAAEHSHKCLGLRFPPGTIIDISKLREQALEKSSEKLESLAADAHLYSLRVVGNYAEAGRFAMERSHRALQKSAQCALGKCRHM